MIAAASDVIPEANPAIAIASDVIVGGSAAYSGDGTTVAFTARPADLGDGPDVYVWRAGDSAAHPVTSDHRTVFSGWLRDRILASRVGGPKGGHVTATSILIDPVTGNETRLGEGAMWRPSVDRGERVGVWWDGTLEAANSGEGWRPGEGRLVVSRWDRTAGSPDATRSDAVEITTGDVNDFQAGWDESATHLAVWIAGRDDAKTGTLSLYTVDPATGAVDVAHPALRDAPARRGFAIASGQLAWVAPAEKGAPRVQVLAWTQDGFGRVEVLPDGEALVVSH